MNSRIIRTAFVLLLATTLTACNLTSRYLDGQQASASGSGSSSRALDLPAPTVTEAPNGTIDLNTLGANANVQVTYPNINNGHTVGLRWTGKATYNAPVQTMEGITPLRFFIPKANIAADVNASGVLTYSVGVDGNPLEISTARPVRVVGNTTPDDYPMPTAPQAPNGTLDLATLGATATVNVTYPTITGGHSVGLKWTGKSQYNAPVQLVGTARPIVFAVPKTALAGDLGGNGIFTYSVGIGDDPLKISDPLPLAIVNTVSSGDAIVAAMNIRYSDTRAACPNNLPAYYCGGVTIRTTFNENYDPWDPSPLAIQLGGISFSYMRKDTRVTDLYHNSGFTFSSQSDAIAANKAQEYLCIYPHDAWTGNINRKDKGCGLHVRSHTAADLSSCASLNVRTLAQWTAYAPTVTHPQRQCSLSTQDPAQFYVSLQARSVSAPIIYRTWNEIMIATWPTGAGARIPLESFFYKASVPASLAEAKAYQTKYKTRTGLWVPIVKLDLTQLNGNPFSYNPADQAVQP